MDARAAESAMTVNRPSWLERERASVRLYDRAAVMIGIFLVAMLALSFWLLGRSGEPGSLLSPPITAYVERHPDPSELLLVGEVSDTTLRFDRSNKAVLYARAGIADYWVVDLPGRQLITHRKPRSPAIRA